MEARYGAAGDRHEEDREEIKPLHLPAHEGGHVDGRVRHEHADDAGDDHAEEQEHREEVTRLLEDPHRHHGSGEGVEEDHDAPGVGIGVDRPGDAHGEHGDHHGDADGELQAARGLDVLLEEAEDHGADDVDHGDRGGGSVGHVLFARLREAVERRGDHVGEGGDDEKREEPAEGEEELAAEAADVLLDDHAHGLAAVPDGGVESREVLDGAEEDAADDDPQKRGKPAEHGGNDGARDGTGARNGRELVRENGEAGGGLIVLAVVAKRGGCFGVRIDAPCLFEPATVEVVAEPEADDHDSHESETVHL